MLYANYRMVCFWLCDVWYFPTLTALRNIAISLTHIYSYAIYAYYSMVIFPLKNILCGLFP